MTQKKKVRKQALLRDALEKSGFPTTTIGAFLLGAELTEKSLAELIRTRMKSYEELPFKTCDATLMKSSILVTLGELRREIENGIIE